MRQVWGLIVASGMCVACTGNIAGPSAPSPQLGTRHVPLPNEQRSPAEATHPELTAALTKLATSVVGEGTVAEWKRTNEASETLNTLAKAGFNDADHAAIRLRYATLPAAGRLAVLRALSADQSPTGRALVLPLLRKHGWVATEFGSAKG